MTDRMIVDLIKVQDEKGLSALYDNYGSALLGIVKRTVRDTSIAEEVLSQTMLKAWNKISTYNSERSSLFTWLNTIARNTSIDKVRLKSYENAQKTDSLDKNVYNIGKEDDRDSILDVEKITSKLDEKYKIVLDLMYLEGYSQSEISKKLDMPLGTVKTRLRTAIQILRDDLKGEKALFMGFLGIILLIILGIL